MGVWVDKKHYSSSEIKTLKEAFKVEADLEQEKKINEVCKYLDHILHNGALDVLSIHTTIHNLLGLDSEGTVTK